MTDPITAPYNTSTAAGYQRFYVTAVIEKPLFAELERYRATRQISRSDAIKRILVQHFSLQTNNNTASNL
jgi:hypothetical protein